MTHLFSTREASKHHIVRRPVNDDKKPFRPSVIQRAMDALGREHYSVEGNGSYRVWENGRWLKHLTLKQFIEAANRKLERDGLPQIALNPGWVV